VEASNGLAGNWSAKLEYDYLGLNSQTFTSPGPFLVGDTFNTGNRNVQQVKLGINYRFGWGSLAGY
jgi:opacity protein-like surface antigen